MECWLAAWCSYKYLNSGPGNVSGIFVHENQSKKIHLDWKDGGDTLKKIDLTIIKNKIQSNEGGRRMAII